MKTQLKCILLKGELAYLGKHILLPYGVTVCGCFTINHDKDKFKNVPEDLISEYQIEEWDITCDRCLDIIDIIKHSKKPC